MPSEIASQEMRLHEVAIQRFLYGRFLIQNSVPTPVVFAGPMDAYAQIQQLWAAPNNPYKFLLDLKDENGTPLYEPYPSPIRYPIMSVKRLGFSYRASQSFGIHRARRIGWPTIANDLAKKVNDGNQFKSVTRNDLGNVYTAQMPQAWNFRYQLDHYCMRPDTQSKFVNSMMRAMNFSGGTPQTWIYAVYPGYYGLQLIRLYLDGEISNVTPDEPEEGRNVEFRTSCNLVLEGYSVDPEFTVTPALWSLVLKGSTPLTPKELEEIFTIKTDLRNVDKNAIFVEREKDLPPKP